MSVSPTNGRARAMVLAAGFGTRLRPLTDELPKPLVPLGDRSLLEHVLDRLRAQGCLPAVVNSHHLSEIFRRRVAHMDGILEVLHEPDIRGTAGGVAGARAFLAGGPAFVTNADVLADTNVSELLRQTPPDGLCLAVAPRSRGEGTVGVGADGRVVRLRGERFGEELAGGDYVCSLGIGETLREELPERGCLIGDVALPLLRAGRTVLTVPATSELRAPGDSLKDYLAENLAWVRARGQSSFVAEGARVSADVELAEVVVGGGATVEGRGPLRRVVVWPGARVTAPLADAVVTSEGRVVPVPPS